MCLWTIQAPSGILSSHLKIQEPDSCHAIGSIWENDPHRAPSPGRPLSFGDHGDRGLHICNVASGGGYSLQELRGALEGQNDSGQRRGEVEYGAERANMLMMGAWEQNQEEGDGKSHLSR